MRTTSNRSGSRNRVVVIAEQGPYGTELSKVFTIAFDIKIRILENGSVTISSLKREKDDVTEVREGFECGINLGSYNDIKVDDVIETFEMREKPRG